MKRMKKPVANAICTLLLITAMTATSCGNASSGGESVSETPTGYPRAEWSRATAILMHTPGIELFDGVMHPSAGLFENYFDVDAAAEEHRNYIATLEKNGIKVYTVAEILRGADMESLRSLAAKSLEYDCTATDDDPAEAEAYRQEVLSNMTREDMIRCIMLRPTVELRSTELNTGYEASYTHTPVMNLYFTRDQSITTPRGHVICNMNSTQRAIETDIIELCYNQIDRKPVHRITGSARLEGGDYIPSGTFAYIGCGMRTNQEAIDQLLEGDLIGHDTLVVCRDNKFWQMQMHLDTYFNVIDRDLVTLVDSRLNATPGQPEYVTVDIYARAPESREYALAKSDVGLVDFLRGRNIDIIGIAESDELHYANNYLAIAPRHIIAVGGQSEKYRSDLAAHGVKVEWLPLENLISGYGAAHCMTQVLEREEAF